MASEPTDLIREADAALDGITPGPWQVVYCAGDDGHERHPNYVWSAEAGRAVVEDEVTLSTADAELFAAAPDLVRRLRDALEASEAAKAQTRQAIDAYVSALATERATTGAALADANATIQRVKALADTYGYTPNMTSAHHEIADQITRAIDGAPDPRRVETAEEPDAAPTGQRNMWDSFCDDCECIHCKPMDWTE